MPIAKLRYTFLQIHLLNVSSKLATNQTAMHIPSNKHIFFVKGWSHGLPVT